MEMFSLKKRMSKWVGFKIVFQINSIIELWRVVFVFYMAAPCGLACKIFVPQPGLKPEPLEMKAQSPNQWTSSEFHEM